MGKHNGKMMLENFIVRFTIKVGNITYTFYHRVMYMKLK